MKKNIIFISTALWIGGIESALVNLLNHIDYNKYSVTCLILYNYTDMAHRIPKNANSLLRTGIKTSHLKSHINILDFFISSKSHRTPQVFVFLYGKSYVSFSKVWKQGFIQNT